ncbi:hypothetical protein DJ568_03370 [Mucilaginibacter hurinus]|uniref:Aromatic hydrocarbon degradation protein n=1 Tax=Mucilaginibacter hurinus TaxID=2201324 RepID=A0A367GQS0_9SPHI|nr:hypothetical protein [Mucilaginibacter hurinus]RCH55809.1 hypothetical protein DJ568_03370 [Mucilaginibacter hurinus]
MKIRYILSLVAIVAATTDSFAQYSQDALRFSTTQTGSTSRIKAIGNANVAIGGDLTSISGNPAGLGFFTKSEFSITPEYDMFKSKATYLGNTMTDKKNTGNLSHAGVVFYNRLSRPKGADLTKGWLSVNYGFSFSRTNDFYENSTYGGTNPNSTITDYYADIANFTNQLGLPDWAISQKLIDVYKIDPDGSDTDPNNLEYRSNVDFAERGVVQTNVITRTGGQSEFNLAIGGNYSNKLYIGGSLGMTSIRYNSTIAFTEEGDISLADNEPSRQFASVFTQNQVTRGTGVNAKLGIIYKPVEAVRLGFNFTTPTWYTMEDSYSEGLTTNISGRGQSRNGEVYPLQYNLRTPLKVAGGLAVFIKQFGFITGDVEYVDYSSANLSSNIDYDASEDNTNIKTLYKGAVNARVGAEARLSSIAYLRGGYNIMGNPMKEFGSSIKTASGGVGFRTGNYSIDATYTHSTGSRTDFAYDLGNMSPSAVLKRSNDNVYLTVAYRF